MYIRQTGQATGRLLLPRADFEARQRAARTDETTMWCRAGDRGNGTLCSQPAVIVFDPVCGFDNTELLVSEVTFTQDQNGTLTKSVSARLMLICLNPEAPARGKEKSQSTGGPVLMRTIEAMQRQLLGLIGRAVVKSISAATKCQTVDVSPDCR